MTRSSNINPASSSRALDPSSFAPTASILVVTWNSAAPLQRMLDSFPDGRREPTVELVLVDNASTDDSLEVGKRWGERTARDVTLIRNDANVGFACALKQAVDVARGELLLVINPDIRLAPGALRTLVNALVADPALGAVGPRIVDQTGRVELTCARRAPNLLASAAHAFGLRRVLAGTQLDPYTYAYAAYDDERDVPCLSGATMLVRRTALASAGGVDDRWFMYFEDLDICERLRRAGWRLRYCPQAAVRHASASSSPRNLRMETWLAVHQEAAVNLFFSVHRGPWAARAHRLVTALGGLFRIGVGVTVGLRLSRMGENHRLVGAGLLRWALTSGMPPGAPSPEAETT